MGATATDAPEFFLVEEFAELLRVGKSTVYNAIAKGEIRVVRIGKTVRIPVAEVRKLTGETSS